MGVVRSIFTTVSGLYNNINPITFSGVNDVIVIRGSDGVLRCSPFQLRFSRLKFTSARNQVHVLVNGKLTDISMTVTSQGDLFFEHEIVRDEADHEKIVDYLQSTEVFVMSVLQETIEAVKKLKTAEQEYINSEREKNLEKRMFLSTRHEADDTYEELIKRYTKFYYMLNSSENFEYLLRNHKKIYGLLEGVGRGTKIGFSVCQNVKIDKSYETVFDAFLVKVVEEPESTVVRLEDGAGRVYFMGFVIFSRLYFSVVLCKRRSHVVEILEKEYNKSVGWSLFKAKKQLKRDVLFSLTLGPKELESLGLNPGRNEVQFKVGGANRQLEASIYMWDEMDRVVVSDIDGTITRSDVRGHLYNLVGKDWTHSGIAPLYAKIVRNGYRMIYLTSRPLGQSFSTKNYLQQVEQDGHRLPPGPVLHNPDGVLEAIYKEVILKRPEEFKIGCLRQVRALFNGRSPYVAGFGNRVTDVVTYKAVNIPENRIYTVNAVGQIQAEFTKARVGTYHTINEFVDTIFPPVGDVELVGSHDYSNFRWWRM